ncbi:MAG: PEP-CTERM sorting domain-containing protein, partial [Planctomycetes bacterium]|nr:PEP-CTERM sorting domain-containing protein [Planctomycetota bacterium]
VVDYAPGASPAAAVGNWIASGFRDGPGGYWDGPGIASSVAAADQDFLTAVGVLDNTDAKVGGKTTFAGEAVDATSILVTYTWWGDANLDGVVDANDYDVIDKNYLFPPVPDNMGWWTGDFTYDGVIDANDYDRIDKAYLFQTGPLAAADGVAPVPTPEPATLALVAVGVLALTRRRRAA